MKKIILAAALLVSGISAAEAHGNTAIGSVKTISGEPKWEKAKDGAWMGADNTWYKLNMKDASVWWSKDGKKWEAVKDGMWQDKEGKWLKIGEKKLWWSKDGKEWAEVPEWKWMGHDGKWYKFDKDWNVWVTK